MRQTTWTPVYFIAQLSVILFYCTCADGLMNNSWQQLAAVNQNLKYSQPATRFPSQQQT